MKNDLIIGFWLISPVTFAQTGINRSIPVSGGQHIAMTFDYPELIKVSTWDKNEISIQGQVSINHGENDDAFELMTSTEGGKITIENKIRNMKSLPQMVTVVDKGQKIIFMSRQEYKAYKEGKGPFEVVSWGVDMEITLEVMVPKNVQTSIVSTFGMVEVKNFTGPLQVEAQYGGVDVALNEKSVGALSAETNYGQIYSNLDIKFEGDGFRERDFYTLVTAKPGTGARYDLKSKYGNVYLRKIN